MNQTTDVSVHDRILAERARYVSAGVSTPKLVVSHADGARVTDVDGRTFIDFAGGIGCQNTGHRFAPVVEAIKAQADEYLHQCFMVGVYEPYVEVCRRLAELSPCVGEQQKSILVNSGAEAVENAVKIARCGDRPACCRRLRQRLPRPHPPDDDDDRQGEAVQGGLRPVRPRGLPGAGAESLPRRLDRRRDRRPEAALQGRRRPGHGRVCRARARAGRGRVSPDAGRLPRSACWRSAREHGILYVDDEVQSGVGRTGKMWAIEHYDGVAPDLLVSGKSIGGGLPLAP